MRAVCVMDTSVFCNLLRIPSMDQDHARATAELGEYIKAGTSLLLPMATVYETGNHIAHQGDGRLRRTKARLFADQVREAFDGDAPWTPTPLHNPDEMRDWLREFPDRAMEEIGLGDLSIIKTFEQQCELNKARHVFIWSYDVHLSGYDRPPEL